MLAVFVFVAFFVVMAFGVFLVAARGGLAGARETLHSQTRGGRAVTNLALLIVYVGVGVVMPVLLLTGNHSNASAQVGGFRLTSGERQGRTLFAEHCGVCHTLIASSAIGKVGPNLDELKPNAALVLNTIINGCLQTPPSANSPQTCLGYGTMPANVLQGKQAQNVAAFVAKVAGKE
ncbi:MAG: c-type cytochrome [Solirubrobacteraceae bacterium]